MESRLQLFALPALAGKILLQLLFVNIGCRIGEAFAAWKKMLREPMRAGFAVSAAWTSPSPEVPFCICREASDTGTRGTNGRLFLDYRDMPRNSDTLRDAS